MNVLRYYLAFQRRLAKIKITKIDEDKYKNYRENYR